MCGERYAEEMRRYLAGQVERRMDASEIPEDEKLRELIAQVMTEESRKQRMTVDEKEQWSGELFDCFRRLDILSALLEEEGVTEIMINGYNQIFVEREGRIEQCCKTFTSAEKLEDVIQLIVSGINRQVNTLSPIADARLPDGSRVNIVLPPASLDGPAVTVRKFPEKRIGMEQLMAWGTVTQEAAEFLQKLVQAGYNLFVSGGTGSGKTTFLNALSEYIPPEERVITIEDSAELQIRNIRNLVRLEARAASQDGASEITIRDLVKTALRMRPDRILIGEIRGPEAIDLLQAMNTGHDGSISTGHANSAQDMLSRIETMVLMGMELPVEAIRGQIASALDIMVHLGRLRDRSRRVLSISEVEGIRRGQVCLRPLYCFQEKGEKDGKVEGALCRTEYVLLQTGKLEAAGLE